jgi:hypothetical protein
MARKIKEDENLLKITNNFGQALPVDLGQGSKGDRRICLKPGRLGGTNFPSLASAWRRAPVKPFFLIRKGTPEKRGPWRDS